MLFRPGFHSMCPTVPPAHSLLVGEPWPGVATTFADILTRPSTLRERQHGLGIITIIYSQRHSLICPLRLLRLSSPIWARVLVRLPFSSLSAHDSIWEPETTMGCPMLMSPFRSGWSELTGIVSLKKGDSFLDIIATSYAFPPWPSALPRTMAGCVPPCQFRKPNRALFLSDSYIIIINLRW